MKRATVARVTCVICGFNDYGVVMAALPREDEDEHPWLLEICLPCLDEMFDVAKLLQMRVHHSRHNFRGADYGPDWNKTREAVLDRDCGQCQDREHQAAGGGELGESLVVHHIKPIKEFGGDYLAANQPENLITLCTICHGRWHAELTRAKKELPA